MNPMRPAMALAVLAALSGLAGCAAPRPPATPEPAAPAAWVAPLPHGGTLADLRQWWQQFDDPVLVDVITAAQAASPDLASATSRVAQARAARVGAQSGLLPGVDGTASLVRGNTQSGLPLATTAQAGLQAAWEIDLFGGRRADADAASARLRGAEAGWHAARVSIAAEAANAYVALRTCQRLVEVTRNDARSRAETQRLTQLSADAGFTAPAVAALARASAAEASARATQQAAQCDLEIKALVALTAIPEPQLRTRLGTVWAEPGRVVQAALPALPAQLLAQRPDVFSAQQDVAAASAGVGAARADRFPRLTLSGQVGRAALRTGGVTAQETTWAIGPLAVSLPVFDAGRRAANEDAAEARYKEAAALYAARVRQAVREVEEALVNLESARARSADAAIAVEGYRASFAATEARYRSGLASLIELEDQRRVTLAAETALVGLQRERIAAWIALYRAVGGGWPGPDAPALAEAAVRP